MYITRPTDPDQACAHRVQQAQEFKALVQRLTDREVLITPCWIRSTDDHHLVAAGALEWAAGGEFRLSSYFKRQGLALVEANALLLLASVHQDMRRNLLTGRYLKDFSTQTILREWEQGIALTPPCCAIAPGRRLIQVFHGNHRLNLALALGGGTIPLLVPQVQADRVRTLTSLSDRL